MNEGRMVDGRIWKILKRHLRYSNEEMDLFRNRAENATIIEKATVLNSLEFRATVVSARGCNSGHKLGETIVFDGAGNLIASRSPPQICIFLLGSLPAFIYALHELVYAGVPVEDLKLRLDRAGCFDVGVENCGWGKVIVQISVHPQEPAAAHRGS